MNLPRSLTKDRIRRSFDRARDTYEQAARVQAEAAATCAAHVPEGHYPAIIEIGAGGGVLTRHVAERCSHDEYVAVDIAPGMLARVDKSLLTKPEFLTADGEFLPLPGDRFDLLVSSSTMQWYRNPTVSIPDNLKLLRRGGRFSLSMFAEGTFAEFAEAADHSGFGSMLPMRGSDFYVDVVAKASPAALEHAVTHHVAHHPTVADLLRAHRATGATATPGETKPSKQGYASFIEYYEKHFREPEGVRATATILHVWGEW